MAWHSSVLVITGNNALIWITIILANCAGTVWAYTHVEADHHSTAMEFVNMLKKRMVQTRKEAIALLEELPTLQNPVELKSRCTECAS